MHGHKGGGLSIGRDFPIVICSKQKLNTQSSTESELVELDDCMLLQNSSRILDSSSDSIPLTIPVEFQSLVVINILSIQLLLIGSPPTYPWVQCRYNIDRLVVYLDRALQGAIPTLHAWVKLYGNNLSLVT